MLDIYVSCFFFYKVPALALCPFYHWNTSLLFINLFCLLSVWGPKAPFVPLRLTTSSSFIFEPSVKIPKHKPLYCSETIPIYGEHFLTPFIKMKFTNIEAIQRMTVLKGTLSLI